MPELPEVEVTRLSFSQRIAGARVISAQLGKPLRWPLGVDPSCLSGRTIAAVRRRGKYLLLDFSDGALLLIHLGMSGSLVFATEPGVAGIHDHFELATTQGHLRLHDPRRFGAVMYCESASTGMAAKLLDGLGPEPLGEEFELAAFHAGLKRRKTAIKQALMAGDLVVGVGNIYASEALFLAGIRPTVSASRLSRARAARLREAVRDVLARAIAAGGSTLRDFSSADGQVGHFQNEAQVYGRAGQPCPQCGQPVRMIRQAQRSTFYCGSCQT